MMCTLTNDGWTGGESRSTAKFLVNTPNGIIFLDSLDTYAIFENNGELFKLLNSIV